MMWQRLGCWVYQPRISGITREHQGSLEPPANGGGDARSPSEPPGGPNPANPGFGLLASRAGRECTFVVETPSLWSLVMAASGQSFQKIRSWAGSNVHHVLRVHLDTCSQHVGSACCHRELHGHLVREGLWSLRDTTMESGGTHVGYRTLCHHLGQVQEGSMH